MQMNADKAVVHAWEATVEILFTPAEPRRIGLVSIPVLNVSFRFSGAEANAHREFMAYFDLYTKRGGGYLVPRPAAAGLAPAASGHSRHPSKRTPLSSIERLPPYTTAGRRSRPGGVVA